MDVGELMADTRTYTLYRNMDYIYVAGVKAFKLVEAKLNAATRQSEETRDDT